jgi:hypothetical protein
MKIRVMNACMKENFGPPDLEVTTSIVIHPHRLTQQQSESAGRENDGTLL